MNSLRSRVQNAGGLVSAADLARHWRVSDQRARIVTGHPDFPQPFAAVNNGRTKLWLLKEAQAFRDQSHAPRKSS